MGNVRQRGHLEDPGVVGRIILKIEFQEVGWGIDWIDLAQDGGGGGGFVYAVLKLRVP